MGKRKKGNYKKSHAELQGYKDFISNSSYSPDSTIPVQNEMLQGSSEYNIDEEEINASDNIKKTPLKYKFGDWLKKNVFPAIITAVLIAIGTAVITHQVNIAVINQRVEYLEKQIDELESDSVEKDLLDLKLKEIVANIDSSYSITFNDIKWQIKELEDKIDSLH